MSDPQDRAEALDDDKVGPEFPPEEPLGVDDPAVTPTGQWLPESLEERAAREETEPEASSEAASAAEEQTGDLLPGPEEPAAEVDAVQVRGDDPERLGVPADPELC
jgi:hypothetical protein